MTLNTSYYTYYPVKGSMGLVDGNATSRLQSIRSSNLGCTSDHSFARAPGSSLVIGSEKSVEFLFDDPIALAGCIFEFLPLQDTDYAAAVLDQSGSFQFRSHFVNAAATDTQHDRQECLRKVKCFGSYPILGRQQPPRTSLSNGM